MKVLLISHGRGSSHWKPYYREYPSLRAVLQVSASSTQMTLLIVPSEFLIHAADVEGLCQGIDEELVQSEAIS